MKFSNKDYVCIVLIIAMLAINIYFQSLLPDKIITHWNEYGVADGWSSKGFGMFLVPVMTVLIYLFFLAIPEIEVYKDNFRKFTKYYDNLKLIFVGFMFALNIIMMYANLGVNIPIGLVIGGLVAALLFYFGSIMPKFKRNYFVGIRTPWALADERVWDYTQTFGGKVFKIMALCILLAIFIPQFFMWLVLVPILAGLFIIFVYSYKEYARIHKSKKSKRRKK